MIGMYWGKINKFVLYRILCGKDMVIKCLFVIIYKMNVCICFIQYFCKVEYIVGVISFRFLFVGEYIVEIISWMKMFMYIVIFDGDVLMVYYCFLEIVGGFVLILVVF